MEDAVSLILNLPRHPDIAFFGVFDGHAGDKCSQFLEENMSVFVDACDNPLDHAQLSQVIAF